MDVPPRGTRSRSGRVVVRPASGVDRAPMAPVDGPRVMIRPVHFNGRMPTVYDVARRMMYQVGLVMVVMVHSRR